MLGDDLVPGAVTPVVRRLGDAVLLGGVRDERDRALRADARLGERARELERDRDAGRVVERGAEPAVVVAGDDRRCAPRRRPGSSPTTFAASALALAAARAGRPAPLPAVASFGAVLLAGSSRTAGPRRARSRRRSRARPAPGRTARPAARRATIAAGPAQAELEADVVRPEPRDLPLDERDLAARRRAGRAACGRRGRRATSSPSTPFAPVSGTPPKDAHSTRDPVRELDVGLLEPPAVDRHRLLDDVLEPERAHLAGDEVGRLALLGRARDPEAERVRADRRRAARRRGAGTRASTRSRASLLEPEQRLADERAERAEVVAALLHDDRRNPERAEQPARLADSPRRSPGAGSPDRRPRRPLRARRRARTRRSSSPTPRARRPRRATARRPSPAPSAGCGSPRRSRRRSRGSAGTSRRPGRRGRSR